jgi:4-carboxymuconolactone decarboxylase
MAKAQTPPAATPALQQAARKARNHRSQAFQAGLAMRSHVLGPDYVQRAFEHADELSLPFQELATEFAWGSVWTRAGLTLRERSLMTMAMCIALNRPRELQIHLRGALRNGVEPELLPEILLQGFLYCGGPATIDAMHAIREAMPALAKEIGARRSPARKSTRAKGPSATKSSPRGPKAVPKETLKKSASARR